MQDGQENGLYIESSVPKTFIATSFYHAVIQNLAYSLYFFELSLICSTPQYIGKRAIDLFKCYMLIVLSTCDQRHFLQGARPHSFVRLKSGQTI